jgi:hypothetical protein
MTDERTILGDAGAGDPGQGAPPPRSTPSPSLGPSAGDQIGPFRIIRTAYSPCVVNTTTPPGAKKAAKCFNNRSQFGISKCVNTLPTQITSNRAATHSGPFSKSVLNPNTLK